jgi:c(7)-type cytochrome triheme protein
MDFRGVGWLGAVLLIGVAACQNPNSRGADEKSLAPLVAAGPAATANDAEQEPPQPPKLIPDPPRKKLSIVTPRSLESLREDGKHDETNDALAVLQDPTEAMRDFPVDRRMQVNWVKTLDQGLIEPRASLDGSGEMLVMDMDILFTNTKDMPYVKFPHLQHTRWLDCSNCHPRIFIPRRGANPVSMNKVLRGEFCGVCHDKVAFSLFICERCHSVPHERSGKWW